MAVGIKTFYLAPAFIFLFPVAENKVDADSQVHVPCPAWIERRYYIISSLHKAGKVRRRNPTPTPKLS